MRTVTLILAAVGIAFAIFVAVPFVIGALITPEPAPVTMPSSTDVPR